MRIRGGRRGLLGAALASTVVTTAAAVALATDGLAGDSAPSTDAGNRPAAVTRVMRQTLLARTTVPGQLDHGPATPLTSTAQGMLTWLPATGSTVRRGDVLLRANERPVVLLYGDLPMFRDLGLGAKGRDVEQLERNLRALGYGDLTVDEEYTEATIEAVQRWQADLAVERTGWVAVGQVVYAPGAVRVESHSARLGDPAAADVLMATGTDRVVTVDADLRETAWAVPGAAVEILIPNRRKVPGVVAAVGTQVTTGGTTAGPASGGSSAGGTVPGAPEGGSTSDGPTSGGSAPAAGGSGGTIPVTVSIADQKALGELQRAPVEVAYTSERRDRVLTVPVAALLALAEGGYGLEARVGDRFDVVAVRTGMFADGRVEVSGPGLTEGMTVGMPG